MELTGPRREMTELVLHNFDRAHFDNWMDPYPAEYSDRIGEEIRSKNEYHYVTDAVKINVDIVQYIYQIMKCDGLLVAEILSYSINDALTLSLASHHVITVFRSQPEVDLDAEKSKHIERMSLGIMQEPLFCKLQDERDEIIKGNWTKSWDPEHVHLQLHARLAIMRGIYFSNYEVFLNFNNMEDFSKLMICEVWTIATREDKLTLIELAEKIDALGKFGPKIFSTYDRLIQKVKGVVIRVLSSPSATSLLAVGINAALFLTILILPSLLQLTIAAVYACCISWILITSFLSQCMGIKMAESLWEYSRPITGRIVILVSLCIPVLGYFGIVRLLPDVLNRYDPEMERISLGKVCLVWNSFPKFPT